MPENESWVLAFDASCATCTHLAEIAARECDGRLDIRPLDRDDACAGAWASAPRPA